MSFPPPISLSLRFTRLTIVGYGSIVEAEVVRLSDDPLSSVTVVLDCAALKNGHSEVSFERFEDRSKNLSLSLQPEKAGVFPLSISVQVSTPRGILTAVSETLLTLTVLEKPASLSSLSVSIHAKAFQGALFSEVEEAIKIGEIKDVNQLISHVWEEAPPVPLVLAWSGFPTVRGLEVGLLFANRYLLLRPLGRGGMGVVWLAQDTNMDGDHVALKFLPEEVCHSAAAIDDLRKEVKNSLKLSDDHVVRIHDLVVSGGTAAITMEYIEGRTLDELRRSRPARVLDVSDLAPLLRQICDVIDYAHGKNIIHRDIKPQNLMVTREGVIKLCDFGLADSLVQSRSRLSGQKGRTTSGTTPYMSPQHLMGFTCSAADDIYSLGATLYELMTGKPPFFCGNLEEQIENRQAPSIVARRHGLGVKDAAPVPREWNDTILHCLAKEAKDRPATAGAVAAALLARPQKTQPAQPASASPVFPLPKGPMQPPRQASPPDGPSLYDPKSMGRKPPVRREDTEKLLPKSGVTKVTLPKREPYPVTPPPVDPPIPDKKDDPGRSSETPSETKVEEKKTDATPDRSRVPDTGHAPLGSSTKEHPQKTFQRMERVLGWVLLPAAIILVLFALGYIFYGPHNSRKLPAVENVIPTQPSVPEVRPAVVITKTPPSQSPPSQSPPSETKLPDTSTKSTAFRKNAKKGGSSTMSAAPLTVLPVPAPSTTANDLMHLRTSAQHIALGEYKEAVQELNQIRDASLAEQELASLAAKIIQSFETRMKSALKADDLAAARTIRDEFQHLLPSQRVYIASLSLLLTVAEEELEQRWTAFLSTLTPQMELFRKALAAEQFADSEKQLSLMKVRLASAPPSFHSKLDYLDTELSQAREAALKRRQEKVLAMLQEVVNKLGASSPDYTLLALKLDEIVDLDPTIIYKPSYRSANETIKAELAPRTPATASMKRPFLNSLSMRFIPVAGQSFLVCQHETTVGQWTRFAKDNTISKVLAYLGTDSGVSKKPTPGGTWKSPGFTQTDQHPVVCIAIQDAEKFATWLTSQERASGKLSSTQRYRLPKSAEWQACAGSGPYAWGNKWPPEVPFDNLLSSSELPADGYTTTAPVGSYPENSAGLFDVGGNVREWVTGSAELTDPQVTFGCAMGGSWSNNKSDQVLVTKYFPTAVLYNTQKVAFADIGFRLVLDLK